jgi:putative ABC transport system ATP-binding protein
MNMNEKVIDARGLVKTFGEDATAVPALRGVDFSVSRGEVVLIMGPSGSGKTTLLSVIGALLKPTSGTVTLGVTELTALSERDLPDIRLAHLGFIFQDFNLLSALTARENVELVLNLAGVKGEEGRRKASELLKDLGLGHRLDFRPDKLSGGEKQRVAIARALANEPEVLLCDEPTANLDSKIGHDIVRRLREIAKDKGKSVVIVSHDTRIKEHADRILWLEDGKFSEMSAMVTDPVCGMSIEKDKAAATLVDSGKTLYFCSKGCAKEYQGKL